MLGPLTNEGLEGRSVPDSLRRQGLDFPSLPASFTASAFESGPRSEGFLPVASEASRQGISMDELLRTIQAQGFEVRAYSGALWYRPAVVTRMGQP